MDTDSLVIDLARVFKTTDKYLRHMPGCQKSLRHLVDVIAKPAGGVPLSDEPGRYEGDAKCAHAHPEEPTPTTR